ncbi:DNA helicase/exodeoxyribonuclease V, beta subunit [Arsukibacterium tuosuense]|uniref:RecBCD enzyme subunit RecB n=1 Tax=Arsukibacterium tuosuense TaxID=1323745 RepID=A0A285IRH5_9GAMM|nr:exodeoxyribonuclease V subunit beta [Arsukibacterium tuosuense]SNY50625.1 DNA helicase/exodeoxyribonuclease V, beta subunit [Arsukibacterium tuosuense]
MKKPEALELLTLPLKGNRLIEASAGTGKTFTIAALYLRLVLGHGKAHAYQRPLTPPEILVVTFTEAATQELRDRIRLRLTEAAQAFRHGESADGVLAALLADYSEAEYAYCARRLELAAQWMDEAAISTIHGWCNRMLAEHAFASGSLFSQQLSTDLTALKLQAARDYWRSFYYQLPEHALTECLSYWQTPEQLWQSVAGLTSYYLERVESEKFSYAEPEVAIAQCQADRQAQLQQLTEKWRQWLPELAELLNDAISTKAVNGRQLQQRFLDNWLQKLHAWLQAPDTSLDLGTGWHRLSPQGIAECWKQPPVPSHPAFDGIVDLQAALQNLVEPRQLLMQHAASWLAHRIQGELSQQALMGFDDMLLRLHRALHGNQGAELAALVRDQYPVALIDEFQDTDPIQYQIFSAIYLKSPATANAGSEPEDQHALLLIGDPKQAIYAFRGADIYTYLKAKRATTGRHYTLDTNFRSDARLVSAVNYIFGEAEARAGGAFLFRQDHGSDNQGPLPFHPVNAKGSSWQLHIGQHSAPALTGWLPDFNSDKALSRQAYLDLYAGGCASYITDILQQAACGATYLINNDGEKRQLKPSDIAVLVNNQNEAQTIRGQLAQRQIRSVYLSDRESVFSSATATDLQLILSACAEPEQDSLLRSAIGCRIIGLNLSELDQLQQHELKWEKLCLQFKRYQQQWRRYGVLPMLRSLLFDFAIPARLRLNADGERALTDLLHLAELLQQAAQQLDGEQALLRFLAEHIQQQAAGDNEQQKVRLESDAELVQVITIHKSKGLEYPLVFLPFICAARPVNAKQLPVSYRDAQGARCFSYQPDEHVLAVAEQERLAEDIRKCYVAVTRAKYACWLGLAPLAEISAISYLLATSTVEPAAFSAQVQTVWAGCPAISLESLPAASQNGYQAPGHSKQTAVARQMTNMFRQTWWIASYSALTRQLGDNSSLSQSGPERASDKLLPELFNEIYHEFSAEPAAQEQDPAIQYQFIAGPQAGTFLHGMLEWMGQQGFAVISQQPELLATELTKRCQLRGWQADCAALQKWLMQLLHSCFTLPGLTRVDPVTLAGLSSYQVELEFWLPCQHIDIQRLDQLLQQHIWPGQPRPALLAGQLNGMLKGFIDLVFCQQQRYVVCDYKSNLAGQCASAYNDNALQQLMLQKRYDLQAVLYCLALHRLLRSRLAGYDYMRDIGGAMHWFIRGLAAPQRGMVWLKPSLELINALDQLFRGEAIDVR